MKQILMLLCLVLPIFAFSQMQFHQGYLLFNGNVTVFSNVNYSLVVKDSMIYLPHKTVHIDSSDVIGGVLTMYLNDGGLCKYAIDPQSGNVFSVIWNNGRLVLWENLISGFQIDIK